MEGRSKASSEDAGLYHNDKAGSDGRPKGARADQDDPDLSMLRGALPDGRAPHICVVGAGLSGLRCAEVSLRNGCDVTIIEARNRIGGRVHESTELGYSIDVGPNWIHGRGYNPLIDIAKETNSVLHSWNGKCNIFDVSGDHIDEDAAESFSELVWDIIEDAFEYSAENGAKIPESESLYDYLIRRSEEIFPVSEGKSAESQREKQVLLQRMSQMWGAYIGDPIERQSLRFAWMEDCCGGGKLESCVVVLVNPRYRLTQRAEEFFVATTYRTILDRVANLALSAADVQLLSRVVQIETLEADSTGGGRAVVRTEDGNKQTFDEVVMTTPLGWLKRNKDAFKPSLTPRLTEAIDGISVGHLEKVFITFPRAFWQGHRNTESPPSKGRPRNTDDEFPSYTNWLSPTYATDTNPNGWPQEAYNLAEFPAPNSHPTLLFYTYGACSAHLTNLAHTTSTKPERDALLLAFFHPYFSRLPNYSASNPDCIPLAFLATDWQHDELAGYGSYCNFQVGARDAAGDVAALRCGLPERRLWFAGEHAAPFHAMGSATGAYLSGEAVARRIVEAYCGVVKERAVRGGEVAGVDIGRG